MHFNCQINVYSLRKYAQLPEVQKRKEEERRQMEYRSYRLNAQLFNKVYRLFWASSYGLHNRPVFKSMLFQEFQEYTWPVWLTIQMHCIFLLQKVTNRVLGKRAPWQWGQLKYTQFQKPYCSINVTGFFYFIWCFFYNVCVHSDFRYKILFKIVVNVYYLWRCSVRLFDYDYIIIATWIFYFISCFSHTFYEANKQLFVRAFVCGFYVPHRQQKSLFSVFD